MRALAILLLLWPGVALAQATEATFDIHVSGIRAGVISIAGEERGGRYAVAGRLESAGVVGAFRNVRYDAKASGAVSGVKLAPGRYEESFRNGDRRKGKAITYRGGVPAVTGEDRDEDDLDPATQGGTVDPLSALWGLLRDVPEGKACRFSAAIFDGARRSRVTMGAPQRAGDRITCAGEYRRVAGYSDRDMRDPDFPFTVTYRQDGTAWEVARIDMETILGRGTMTRR